MVKIPATPAQPQAHQAEPAAASSKLRSADFGRSKGGLADDNPEHHGASDLRASLAQRRLRAERLSFDITQVVKPATGRPNPVQPKLYKGPRYLKPRPDYEPNVEGWPGHNDNVLDADTDEPHLGSPVQGDAKSKVKAVQEIVDFLAPRSKETHLWNAHMISQSMGGEGDADNVEPWSERFEGGEWKRLTEIELRKDLIAPDVDLMYMDVETDEGWKGADQFGIQLQRWMSDNDLLDQYSDNLFDILSFPERFTDALKVIPAGVTLITPKRELRSDDPPMRWPKPNIDKMYHLVSLINKAVSNPTGSEAASIPTGEILLPSRSGDLLDEKAPMRLRQRISTTESGVELKLDPVERQQVDARRQQTDTGATSESASLASQYGIPVVVVALILALIWFFTSG